jgi:hypothetical protein
MNQLNTGDQVGMWQAFLFDWTQIPCSSFDGIFGSATAQGTRNVQAFWGIPADGVVGAQMWATAGNWLAIYGNDGFSTYWHNPWSHRTNLSGEGEYQYIYGGNWNWVTAGEEPYSYSLPEVTWIDSNHPTRFFAMHCGSGG